MAGRVWAAREKTPPLPTYPIGTTGCATSKRIGREERSFSKHGNFNISQEKERQFGWLAGSQQRNRAVGCRRGPGTVFKPHNHADPPQASISRTGQFALLISPNPGYVRTAARHLAMCKPDRWMTSPSNFFAAQREKQRGGPSAAQAGHKLMGSVGAGPGKASVPKNTSKTGQMLYLRRKRDRHRVVLSIVREP